MDEVGTPWGLGRSHRQLVASLTSETRISTTGAFSPTVVSSGREFTIHQCTVRGSGQANVDSVQGVLDRQNLFAAGHLVGLSGAGLECGLVLPGRCRTLDRPSRFEKP
jgi:hypothetical protein